MTFSKNPRPAAVLAAVLVLGLGLATAATSAQTAARQNPPEYNEVVAASRIQDPAARLKEFERIKAAYPDGAMAATVESFILNARIELAPSLAAVLDLQKAGSAGQKGANRLAAPYRSAFQILEHPRLKTFEPAKVLAAVLEYRDAAVKAAEDPDTFAGVNEDEKKWMTTNYVAGFGLPVALAHLNAADASQALSALEKYKKAGGAASAQYSYVLGEAFAASGKEKDALEAYLNAAVENHRDAVDKAKALYAKSNGGAAGFEGLLEAKLKALPFHPEPFKAPADWKGKAVLAELFTGSECPPCVGADLGFDGLIESIPSKYLVVLEYHLPIPRPDPMMNPATKKRQDVYGVNSTPTVLIDGTEKMVGGGSRGMAEGKYRQYKAVVEPRLSAAPEVSLKIAGKLADGVVKAVYDFDKAVPGAEYHVVLVQGEQEYKGSNGLAFHKLVVRDLVTIDPAAAKSASFDLAASEKAADAYLTEFEKTYTRIPNFKWAVRHNAIARRGLKVVFFAQDKETKKVLNAVVVDVD